MIEITSVYQSGSPSTNQPPTQGVNKEFYIFTQVGEAMSHSFEIIHFSKVTVKLYKNPLFLLVPPGPDRYPRKETL